MAKRTVYIYTLHDPRTKRVCYVGLTYWVSRSKTFALLPMHWDDPKVRAWKLELEALELKPKFNVVEDCRNDGKALRRLEEWQERWAKEGHVPLAVNARMEFAEHNAKLRPWA